MSGADRQQPHVGLPTADQLRMFMQSVQQQFQAQQSSNPAPTKSNNSNASEKQSPALDENNIFEMLMNNPEYQKMMNYGQMGSAVAQSTPIQHPLAAAAANPENPAFRALIAHSSASSSGLPFGVYPNFVPEIHPEMLAANPYYANGMSFGPYMGGIDAGRRKNATREVTMPLKKWLSDHRRYPYPNKAEKMFLAIITKMSLTQVSTWFANARRRLKKENKMTWSPRCRPGDEEDEDDLGDADNEPLSPSSINSADEIKRETSNSYEEQKSTKRPHPESSNDEAPTPKRKILSVNDMLSNNSHQSPNQATAKCKSPRPTTPPSSSSNGTLSEGTPNTMSGVPPLPPFSTPNGQGFPFPFLPGANPVQIWNPQVMAMLAAMSQNAAARNPVPFSTVPPMNPGFLQQMLAVQQMANFMRSGSAGQPVPSQPNPAMLSAMQGFLPSTSSAPATNSSSPTTKTSVSNRLDTDVAVAKPEQTQSPTAINTSSSSISETVGTPRIVGS